MFGIQVSFLYPWVAFVGIPLVLIVALWRWFGKTGTAYRHPLVTYLIENGMQYHGFGRPILFACRFLALICLVLLAAGPHSVDVNTVVNGQGVDMMLALDVSGSMILFDDLHDRTTRFDRAKREAVSFIKKRPNDQIGVVLFGAMAVVRCPMTCDKKMLTELVEQYEMGQIDQRGTMLCTALATAANALKETSAASKVIILLTDGEPSQGDVKPSIALDLLKHLEIKVYTIGIGTQNAFSEHPMFGVRREVGGTVNDQLLQLIADQTGGRYFKASDPKDLANIYQTIDELEKSEYETIVYRLKEHLVLPFALTAMLSILLALLLRIFVWWGVAW